MILHVLKLPSDGSLAHCMEISSEDVSLLDGWEIMTIEEFNLWVSSQTVIIDFPEEITVPSEIASWRAKYVLRQAGLIDSVVEALAQLPEPMKSIASEAWEGGAPFVRNGPLVEMIGTMIPTLTDEVIDQMFIQAASLPA